MRQDRSTRAGSGVRAWFPHLVLLVLGAGMVLVARGQHTSSEDAFRTAFDAGADPDERIWAMHLIANRGTELDPRLGVGLVESFLSSTSDKVREAALLIDLCRHAIQPPGAPVGAAPPIQDQYAYGPRAGNVWTPHRIRCLVFHRRKVGGSSVGGVRRMELAEVQWVLDSMAGKPSPSNEEVDRYFSERNRRAGGAPGTRGSFDD